MQQCIEFWKENLSERWNPIERKRQVCCEPLIVPTPKCISCYKFTHPRRENPYNDDETTRDLKLVYEQYEIENAKQVEDFSTFYGPLYLSTLCRSCGCRRCLGRKGLFFCSEGCTNCSRKRNDPAPHFETYDFDNDWDASTVLLTVLGPPPKNVHIRRWRWDPVACKQYLELYPSEEGPTSGN
jgi:hypothetical protein